MKKQKKEKAKEKLPPDQQKITRLVREIISGRPINQVPDKLLPRVHIELSCAKSRAMKDGLFSRIQMIQKVMLDVEQYEKERAKLKSVKSRSKSSILNREDNSKFSNDDSDDIDAIFEIYHPPPVAVLDSILDDLADGIPFEIAETPNIPYLIDRSKERINEYLQSGEYFTAQRYENVHIQLVSLIEDRKREKKIENKLNYLTNLLNENQARLKEIKDDKKKKLDEHEKKINDSLTKSREEYEKANREYDEITNGPLPISFRKFSSEYLNTREKERFLIQSRRYEEAASIKAEADRMEAKELSMLCDEFVEKREKKKKIIEERQNKALNCIIENGERTKLRIINEYDQKIQELQRTVENIQNRIKLTDSNYYIEENQPNQSNQQNQNSSFSNLNYLKSIPDKENGQTAPNSNIKKNTSKYTLPAVPRETMTSKLRSSPFVTQAAPQITSPEKSNLNRNKNQNQNQNQTQNKFIKREKKDFPSKTKIKQNFPSPEKETTKASITFSSSSFISSDDEEHQKNNQSKISINDIININSDNDNNNNNNDTSNIDIINNSSLINDNDNDNNDTINNSILINDNDNIDVIINNNSQINDNMSSDNNNESINISFNDSIDADENKRKLSFDKKNEKNIGADDFIVDDNNSNDDNDDVFVAAGDHNGVKNSEIGKNLIRKKKKNDVMQPNSQLIRNKNTLNHEYHRPVSVQKKLPAPAKRSRSQVRDQPPSPHLYSPNLKARKKNDKNENPIRTAKSSSKK